MADEAEEATQLLPLEMGNGKWGIDIHGFLAKQKRNPYYIEYMYIVCLLQNYFKPYVRLEHMKYAMDREYCNGYE